LPYFDRLFGHTFDRNFDLKFCVGIWLSVSRAGRQASNDRANKSNWSLRNEFLEGRLPIKRVPSWRASEDLADLTDSKHGNEGRNRACTSRSIAMFFWESGLSAHDGSPISELLAKTASWPQKKYVLATAGGQDPILAAFEPRYTSTAVGLWGKKEAPARSGSPELLGH
jgi:hypothetical protein